MTRDLPTGKPGDPDWVQEALERAAPEFERVARAQHPRELIQMAGGALGIFRQVWAERLTSFGQAGTQAIATRLLSSQSIADEETADKTVEDLIYALWYSKAPNAVSTLLSCFNSLDVYGQSIACVALGLMGDPVASDVIWRYFQRVKPAGQGATGRDTDFIGALWGLIELSDPRATDALAEAVLPGMDFYELPGFAARVGDARVVGPLVVFGASDPEDRDDYTMALAGIAQRIGREATVQAVFSAFNADSSELKRHEAATQFTDMLFRYSPEDVVNYFEPFYKRS